MWGISWEVAVNNWYQAILDLEAGPEEAKFLALKVTTKLMTAGIIEPASSAVVNGGTEGLYKPGKNFVLACSGQGGTQRHDLTNLGGMETEVGPWVNMLGLSNLEAVSCPTCGTQYTPHNAATGIGDVIEGFSEASQQFYGGTHHPKVECPTCHGEIPAHDWQTMPHLGFCHLTFIFWNWPPFSEWDVDVPQVISDILNHKTVVTYGSHH